MKLAVNQCKNRMWDKARMSTLVRFLLAAAAKNFTLSSYTSKFHSNKSTDNQDV